MANANFPGRLTTSLQLGNEPTPNHCSRCMLHFYFFRLLKENGVTGTVATTNRWPQKAARARHVRADFFFHKKCRGRRGGSRDAAPGKHRAARLRAGAERPAENCRCRRRGGKWF